MSKIADAIARKKQQLPQYEYLWRVELPTLGTTGINPSVNLMGIVNQSTPLRQIGEQVPSPVKRIGEQIFDYFNKQSVIQSTNLDELSHRVTSIDAPMPSIESKKNTHKGSFVYTASNNEIGSLTLKMDEMEDGLTLDYITTWMNLITRDDGFYNPPAIYKRDIKIIRMSSTELDIHVSTYHGYFPTEVSPVSYSYDSNGILQYSITLTGDSVSHKIIPASQVRQIIEAEQSKIMNGYSSQDGFGVGGFSSVLGAAGMIINNDKFSKIINTVNKVIKIFG
jgi:hypothetical protein